jgi:hypothetical protein
LLPVDLISFVLVSFFFLSLFLTFFRDAGSTGHSKDGKDEDGSGSVEEKDAENEIDEALLEEETEDKTTGVVQRVPSFHSSKHPITTDSATNLQLEDVRQNADDDDDDESVTSLLDPQQAIGRWYELVDQLKEDTLRKKNKIGQNQVSLCHIFHRLWVILPFHFPPCKAVPMTLQRQSSFLKSEQKLLEKKEKILSRRKACFRNEVSPFLVSSSFFLFFLFFLS